MSAACSASVSLVSLHGSDAEEWRSSMVAGYAVGYAAVDVE